MGFTMPLVELHGVNKSYHSAGKTLRVLKDIELTIEEGEFVAIVGYSGSGKTTLMSLLAGLIRADSGTLALRGQPITAPGRDRGVVFQNYSLLPWLTVLENVRLAVDQWTNARLSCLAECGNALVWRGRWRWIQTCSSWTSRSAHSML